MKYATRGMVVAAGLGLVCVLALTGSAQAPAASPDSRLKGAYAVDADFTCLNAPGGFNSRNQPKTPAKSFWTSGHAQGVSTFDGAGKFTAKLSGMAISWGHAPGFVPSAGSWVDSLAGTYRVAPDAEVTLAEKESGKSLSGPSAGKAFRVLAESRSGYLSADNKTLLVGTPGAVLNPITLANGKALPRICHISGVAVKI